ncbi:hypothetical protein CVT24_000993 [Panaeolus cyanescens]|uniref:F-box domain-containing protein n=1 Tax=Panaeolus cyanescens TaxID=181874 RepID=A0A409YCH0_9AGAR|nr:hypothetical protein CVT24_000993 [Panaeolus cyanescens]
MGVDTFCPLSGLHWYNENTFLKELEYRSLHDYKDDENDVDMHNAGDEGSEDDEDVDMTDTSQTIKHNLKHTTEDAEHSKSWVMICVAPPPIHQLEKITDILVPEDVFGDYDCPEQIHQGNVAEVFNLIAENSTGEADEFLSKDLMIYGEEACFLHHCFGTGLAVNFWAYLIFRHACPKVLPHIMFKMHRNLCLTGRTYWSTFQDVQYGPIRGTFEQWVDWTKLGISGDEHDGLSPWQDGLLRRPKSPSDVLDDAWNGDGALWTTVRPNHFPIEAAARAPFPVTPPHMDLQMTGAEGRRLETCPPEILVEITKHLSPRQFAHLFSTSKTIRMNLMPHADYLAHRHIQQHQPWLFPAGSVPFSDSRFGREEIDAWITGWSNAGIDLNDIERNILPCSALIHSPEDARHSKSYAMICVAAPVQQKQGLINVIWPDDPDMCGKYDGAHRISIAKLKSKVMNMIILLVPEQIDETNTIEIFNLHAENTSGAIDEFVSSELKGRNGQSLSFLHHCFRTGLPVNYWAYLILRHACPNLLPHIIFKLHQQQRSAYEDYWGTFNGVDYGPTWGTLSQFANWRRLGIYQNSVQQDMWPDIMFRDRTTLEEATNDAWNGEGALWTTVRPNKFPIAEAASIAHLNKSPSLSPDSKLSVNVVAESGFATLPLEIMLQIAKYLSPRQMTTLLSISKASRNSFTPHIDYLSRLYIKDHQPWLLPAGPVTFTDPRFGREELDAWMEGWAAAGVDIENADVGIPWFAYAQACHKSMHMRSRQRIWNIAKQIEKLAIENNYM